jgi:energy-coupling factor transporter ATP-binding protein EcfA2
LVKRVRLSVERLGPILKADVEFGDLTVVVGPQASGKSIFLQTLKLQIDRNHIQDTFSHHSTVFNNDPAAFMGAYFGRGMGGMLAAEPSPTANWTGKDVPIADLTKRSRGKGSAIGSAKEKLFYIPAQRVVSLPGGKTAPFGSFEYGDPFVLRYFADRIHVLLQNEFGSKAELFPASNRLNASLRDPIEKNFFGGARLELELKEYTKTLTLKVDRLSDGLPYLAWSAGQREFAPLLLGLYWLCPAGKVSTRDELEWVVIEEPEMGLHPRAIASVLLLVIELMRRGYRVVLSTHSPVVLDLVWAIQSLKEFDGSESDVRAIFELKSNETTKHLAQTALSKSYRTYYFERGSEVHDISSLDPSDQNEKTALWGGLIGFSTRVGEVVAKAVNRYEGSKSREKQE